MAFIWYKSNVSLGALLQYGWFVVVPCTSLYILRLLTAYHKPDNLINLNKQNMLQHRHMLTFLFGSADMTVKIIKKYARG